MVDMLKVYSQQFTLCYCLVKSLRHQSVTPSLVVPLPPPPPQEKSWIRPWGTSTKLSET